MRLRVFPFSVPWLLAFLFLVCILLCNARAAPKYRVLHAFTAGSDGGGLWAAPILDDKGNLYGMTSGGGAYGEGTVWELSPAPGGQWTESVLYSFCHDYPSCSDGGAPFFAPVFDAVGNLYGVAGYSTFEMTLDPDSPTGWQFQMIYPAGSNDGLVMDAGGNLYGTWGPGEYGEGDVFERSQGPEGWSETVLYSFDLHNGHDGFDPLAPLILDSSGNLYGTTKIGGANGYGTVFQLKSTPGGWKEHILHSFPAFEGDGKEFYAGLVMDKAGNLYGATPDGGAANRLCTNGCGTIFKLTRQPQGGWKETILHTFPELKGGVAPLGTLVFDVAGNLYGTTAGGGDTQDCGVQGCGTVFKMTPGSDGKWQYQVLHRFTGADGIGPQAGVVLDQQGNIYGTTVGGGAGGYGVVFEIKP